MGRGVSSGGGQSSLGYLFGSGEAPKPAETNAPAEEQVVNSEPPSKKPAPPVDVNRQAPAGIHSNKADGQNTGDFITDRPSTKVHSAPGGGSSLGYLFGGPSDGK
ncbi:protein SPIRAL1-like 1 [Prosopis cineraria]|uniref:protein SPIRAL1-like 1 n=1 Tax=Prosopis cineraria TaxID=364024 RepID=UPI0024109006|nr:protein SPIRAL1-like 1 [Prosopis cineraria]